MRCTVSHLLSLSTLALAATLTGCGGSSGSSTPPPPPSLTATTTTLTATPTSAATGATVTLSATVKLSTTGGNASGSVTFLDGSTTLATSTLAAGVATTTVTTLAIGDHSLSASFTATSTEAASSSATVKVTVTQPTVATTVTLTSAAANVLSLGLPIELVAQVTAASGTAIPTGTAAFSQGSTSLGSATLDASGRAITTVTTLPAGDDSLTVTYSGDPTFTTSTSAALPLTIAAVPGSAHYTNPLTLNTSLGTAVSCADPATIKAQTAGVNTWYLYCTSDALTATDGAPHYINIFESKDLITWTYDGNAFNGLPSWAPNGQLWAPAPKFINGQYYLYYTSPSSNVDSNGGAAIGVGTSASPKGPFADHGSPVVEPEPDCCGGDRSTIDPEVVTDSTGQRYITFGSFDGGIFARKLSADGFTSDKTSEVQIAATDRYEGGSLWQHGGFWYLFASSANCCNAGLSGYSVFVGRSATPMGPFVDADGVSMAAVNAGGQEVLAQNGNNWIGPGGNVLFTDEVGRDYMLYHAIPLSAPAYAGNPTYTARPALIDAMEWSSTGWPSVRGGFGPSDTPQPAPAAQPAGTNAYTSLYQTNDAPGSAIASLSDDFTANTLSSQWSALHAAPAYTFNNGSIYLPTVSLDSCCQMSSLPILAEAAPATDYMVETKMTINLPVTGSGYDYAQGDLFIYGDDQDFLRLDVYSNSDTRQIEFIKQTGGGNGSSNLARPSLANNEVSSWLRIVKRTIDGKPTYTAYSSLDGVTWNRGATWILTLTNEKIGISAGNLAGFTVSFDYVHVSTLQ